MVLASFELSEYLAPLKMKYYLFYFACLLQVLVQICKPFELSQVICLFREKRANLQMIILILTDVDPVTLVHLERTCKRTNQHN